MELESGKIYGNMSESQMFESYLHFVQNCQKCRLAHHECRKVPDCSKCECGYWIKQFGKHFGVEITSW